MRLHRLEIHNYKSLRNVAIEPTPLAVFVGPNAAGKTNLADAIDFLRYSYEWDLEKAVAYKGGYESIGFRDAQRSKDPIRFRVAVELPWLSWTGLGSGRSDTRKRSPAWDSLLVDHSFAFRARSRSIQAPYRVVFERLVLSRKTSHESSFQEFCRFTRDGLNVEIQDQAEVTEGPIGSVIEEALQNTLERELQEGRHDSGFMLSRMRHFGWETDFGDWMSSLRVFQMDPRSCRESGVPTPNPDLDRSGRNLPVALDHLKKMFQEEYSAVLETARRVMPSLEVLETDWTHTRSLALFLKERGIRRPWTSGDISDGTIQMIAVLVAVFDPRSPLVVIEEPENSIHPWALRNLVEAFRLASEKKQILLTTHSPILIDQLKPEEVWVVQKPGIETKIDPLLTLDPSLKESWGQGKFTLSEYLDSGAVPEAVPAVNS